MTLFGKEMESGILKKVGRPFPKSTWPIVADFAEKKLTGETRCGVSNDVSFVYILFDFHFHFVWVFS